MVLCCSKRRAQPPPLPLCHYSTRSMEACQEGVTRLPHGDR